MTLDELDAAYAAMTPGEYHHDLEMGRITAPVRRVKNCTGTIAVIHLGLRTLSEFEADGAGFVALHNAFPVLRDRLKRAEELLRLFADHRDCHEIRAFLAESDKPLCGGSA